ncbi:hypothetical protein [Streptomyces sp. C]|uniref:hypothetical protein n=1 Tax=Streptomyces sp. C TaxID=253839 RepID=UPI00101B5225|nr:hypothetical protein [Streptomyces sp. C]
MTAPTAAATPARSAVRRTAAVVMALLAGAAVATAPAGAAGRVPDPLNVSASSAAGVVTSAPACSPGPLTDGRLLTGSASLNPGVFSSLASQLGVSLPFRVGATQAALPEDDARVALSNARGTLTLALKSGTCSSPTLSYDGTTVTGSGTWTVVPDSAPANAYRGASGTGSFGVAADVTTGSGKPWSLSLTGSVSLLQPQVAVTRRAYWGGLGNYLSRTLSVEYRIRNTGPGDAFNVKLLDAPPTSPGITRLGPVPQTVGSIRSGATASVVVRYRVCGIAVVGCRFTADTQTSLTDALDGNLHTETVPVTVQVPLTPLP